jgi:hypothetical protein
MAGDRKPIKAELKADPMDEMGRDVIKWFNEYGLLKKIFAPITYSETVELDPRKWNKKTVDEGVAAVARYELKLLAVRVGAEYKKFKGESEIKDVMKRLNKEYADIAKEIKNKVSLALEELQAGTGESKKLIAELKKGLDGVDDIEEDKIFKTPRNTAVKALGDLQKAINATELKGSQFTKQLEQGRFKAEVDAAESALSSAIADFTKDGKAAQAAIEAMLKVAGTVKKDKDAPSELVSFATAIVKDDKDFNTFLSDAKAFEAELTAAHGEIRGGKMKHDEPGKRRTKFEALTRLDQSAKDVLGKAKKWFAELKKIEKALK